LSRLDGRQGAAAERPRDSRECPGPTTEAELSRPSTHRVLTAGAVVLAAIAPAVEPAERTVNAGPPPPSATPAVARKIGFGPIVGFSDRPIAGQRASRSAVRRGAGLRPATPPVRRAVRHVAPVRRTAERSAHRSASRLVVSRRAVTKRPAATYRAPAASPRMAAVVAFALSQVGKDYVRGGEGPNGFDCSGFTRRAYARAGLRLPHSSGGQAARARIISRALARPGDLVVGPGHVGVYIGGGMMVDAGNRRTGVVYRHLYAGLHIERF
jgi:cell wall-associated NlpC family hydrolase